MVSYGTDDRKDEGHHGGALCEMQPIEIASARLSIRGCNIQLLSIRLTDVLDDSARLCQYDRLTLWVDYFDDWTLSEGMNALEFRGSQHRFSIACIRPDLVL